MALGIGIGRPHGIAATQGPITIEDSDGDGIVDQAELILGTDPFLADSDGDTFTDLEEVSRQTDPLDVGDTPSGSMSGPASVGMIGRVDTNGELVAQMPIYLPGGSFGGVDFRVGVMIGGIVAELQPEAYLPISTAFIRPGKEAGDLVVSLEMRIPESFIHNLGSLSIYATASSPAMPGTKIAATMDLFTLSGVVMMLGPLTASGFAGGGADDDAVTLVYRPLDDPGSIPTSWSAGQFCSQATATVGAVGAVLQQQITSADCVQADGFCRPDCDALIGHFIEVLDPLVLIGG